MKYLILFFLLLFPTFVKAEVQPFLNNITCSEFWAHHKKVADSNDSMKFTNDLMNIWNFQIEKFKYDYPDIPLIHPMLKIYSIESLNPGNMNFMMLALQACEMREENKYKIFGESLAKKIYLIANSEYKNSQAKKVGCRLSNPKDAMLYDPNKDGLIIACTEDNFRQSNYAGGVDQEGNKGLKYCIWPRKGDQKEVCQIITPTDENICLSEFGDCRKGSDNKCAWIHNEQSKTCLNTKRQ